MNLGRDQMPDARKRAESSFASRLQASGRERGIYAAKKSDAEGEILIYDVIGEDFWTGQGVTAPAVAEKLGALKGVKTLHVYINSPGGDLFTGKTVYNEIKRFAAEKIVHVDGIAASAASLIAMAGTRIVTEAGGTWLVHEVAQRGTSMGRGTATDHETTARELRTETQAIVSIYEQRTKCPADRLCALMARDEIIGAAEAKSYGLTDEISETEQRRADEEQAAASKAQAALSALPASDRMTLARIKRRELEAKFPGASPGPTGEPVKTSRAAPERKP